MSDNSNAFAALDAFAERLRAIPDLAEEAAPKIAELLKEAIAENIAAQRNPYGDTFAPRKPDRRYDGKPMFANAMKAIEVKARGTVILITLDGVEAMHHIGNAKGYKGGSKKLGGYRRTLIPTGQLPGPFRGVIRATLAEKWQHLGRRKK